MSTEYSFYSKQKTVEELMLEVAQYELTLNKLQGQMLTESQNPQLAKDIAEVKRKIAAANKALDIASKLKGDKGNAHKSNIMKQRSAMTKKLGMLQGHSDKIESGGVIGKGEVDKKKDDKSKAKDLASERREKNKQNRLEARAKSKANSEARKAEKAAAKAAKKKPAETEEKPAETKEKPRVRVAAAEKEKPRVRVSADSDEKPRVRAGADKKPRVRVSEAEQLQLEADIADFEYRLKVITKALSAVNKLEESDANNAQRSKILHNQSLVSRKLIELKKEII